MSSPATKGLEYEVDRICSQKPMRGMVWSMILDAGDGYEVVTHVGSPPPPFFFIPEKCDTGAFVTNDLIEALKHSPEPVKYRMAKRDIPNRIAEYVKA